jgi:DNA-3-methyladenine glycosylase II
LSRQKISYLKNIAKAFKNKSFDVRKLKKMNDDEAINYITKLKGLGVWSSQMLMIFNLNRPDVFPVKDIGLLRAISKNYRKTSYPPSKKFLEKFLNYMLVIGAYLLGTCGDQLIQQMLSIKNLYFLIFPNVR